MRLFLDSNAHMPMCKEAIQDIVKFNSDDLLGHGNAMASTALGKNVASWIEQSRKKIATLIGATDPGQIIFTSSGTQACEWGLEILAAQGFERVFTSQVEHNAVSEKARELFGNNDLFTSKDGVVGCSFDPGENSAIVCMHVQNELGTIQPIDQIKVPFFSDLSQSIGKIDVNVSAMPNLKVAAFGAHKFGGPVGIGILYVQDKKWWKPFGTGSRYMLDRPGTPDAVMIHATATALNVAVKTIRQRYENALLFNTTLETGIKDLGIEIIGEGHYRIPHTTFIKIGKKMGHYIISQLEAEGIHVGSGSACGAIHSGSNPVMSALGMGGSAKDYIRISQWGNYGVREAKMVLKALARCVPKVERID